MTLDDARLLKQLVVIDKTVTAAEGEGIEARWKFGRLLLEHRIGKKLPSGLLDDVAEEAGKEKKDWPGFRRECQRRMQLAERYPDRSALRHACRNKSWFELAQELSGNVHFSSDSPEWFTPKEIIERAIKTLGVIDLDPCSDAKGNVPAGRRFTKEDDGLKREWTGRIYMNPPYGDDISGWIEKLRGEYLDKRTTEAIALVPARVDTAWFRMLRDFPVCFVSGRLKFSGHDNSAPFPSAVFYLGKRPEAFFTAFSDLGDVWIRWQPE